MVAYHDHKRAYLAKWARTAAKAARADWSAEGVIFVWLLLAVVDRRFFQFEMYVARHKGTQVQRGRNKHG